MGRGRTLKELRISHWEHDGLLQKLLGIVQARDGIPPHVGARTEDAGLQALGQGAQLSCEVRWNRPANLTLEERFRLRL